MSKGAYEMLLQANGHLQEGRKEEAIRAYREVLRLNPTPPQRQVAEAQLRELGELPMTFANSGKVIRRQGPPPTDPGGGAKPRRGGALPVIERRPSRGGAPERRGGSPSGAFGRKPPFSKEQMPLPVPPIAQGRSPSPPSTSPPSSPSSGNLPAAPWSPRPQSPTPSSAPLSRSERLLSVLDTMFKPKPREAPPVVESRPLRDKEGRRGPPRGPKSPVPSKAPKEAKPPHPEGEPCPPKRRPKENETDFAKRLARYEIWLQAHKAHPAIDINVAEILHTKQITLETFRAEQENRRKIQKEKRKNFHEKLKKKNDDFEGSKFFEGLIAKKAPLWFLGNIDHEERAILTDNRIYYAILRTVKGRKKRVHKLDLQLLCEKDVRSSVGSLIRLEEAQALKHEDPPRHPEGRLAIPEATFEQSWEEETPLFFKLYNGAWLKGYVAWYDPYQFGLVLLPHPDGDPAAPKIEVMVFRHAVLAVQSNPPSLWSQWPTFLDWKTQHAG